MTKSKTCFLNHERPCDLTCKAAFEVDDPIDNVDCHFIWLAFHFGEGVFEFKNMMANGSGPGGAGFPGGTGGPGPVGGPGKGQNHN